jgi:hypothetical protein
METSSFEPASVRSLPPAEAEYTPPPIVSAGSLIGRTFDMYFRNVVPLVLISALFHLPSLVMILAHVGRGRFVDPVSIADGVISNVLSGALVYFAFMKLSRKPVGVGRAVTTGLSRFFPLLGVSVVVGLLVMIGTWMLIVPGVILACMWFVALPAVVVERAGVFGSLARSRALTSGSRWSILGACFVVIGLVMLVNFIAGYVGSAGNPLMVKQNLWAWTTGVLSAPLGALLPAIAYHDLRLFKEGTQLDELTSIFE